MFFTVTDRQIVRAPLDRVFLLSTSVPVVARTLGFRAAAGVVEGRVEAGSQVLWRGWLFGLPQLHLTRITDFASPHTVPGGDRVAYFQDSQEAGRFQFFQHDHHMLAATPDVTLLQDRIRFSLPLGPAGALVGRCIMAPFIARTLRRRMVLLTHLAETAEGDRYLAS